MAGCLNCSSTTYCYECNRTEGYYLSGSSCKLIMTDDSYTYGQSSSGIILQFRVSGNSTQYSRLRNIDGSFSTVIEEIKENSTILQPVKLNNQSSCTIKGDIVTVRFENPEHELRSMSVMQVNYD